MFKAIQYKVLLFGEDVLIWSAIGALIAFLLLSVIFFNYPKFFLNTKGLTPKDDDTLDPSTTRLIDDRPADYVSSVTENTTKGLRVPREGSRRGNVPE
jgi:hypothetical protein